MLFFKRFSVQACFLASLMPLVAGCDHTPPNMGEAQKLYDFDHKVHYTQIKYSDTNYTLWISADSYQAFNQQSVFLLRHSRQLCAELVPQITLKKGIQRFERLPTEPRPYQPDLHAEVTCVSP